MNIIFLDVDGVLNSIYSKTTCEVNGIAFIGIDSLRIKRLAEIVNATDAKIVLTSDWGRCFEINEYHQNDKFARYLMNKLNKHKLKVYDKINWGKYKRIARAEAIMDWLLQHRKEVDNYIILDDEYFPGYHDPAINNRLINCFDGGTLPEQYCGITPDIVEVAIDMLKNGTNHDGYVDKNVMKELKKLWGTK